MNEFFLQIILAIYNSIGFQNLGISIIEIAVLSRIVFWPFMKQQLTQGKKMSDLQPKISALKDKHKDNQQAFAAAQMELFKEHGINPAAGCLPTIVQLVIMIGLFGALNEILSKNLNTGLWIWDMAKPDVFHIQGINFPIPGVLVIFASLTQYIQSKMMLVPQSPKGDVGMPEKPHSAEATRGKEKSNFASDFAEAQSSMIWMFPLMFLWFGTQWPSGTALYWSISSVIMIVQQYLISGLGGLASDVVKLTAWKKRFQS